MISMIVTTIAVLLVPGGIPVAAYLLYKKYKGDNNAETNTSTQDRRSKER